MNPLLAWNADEVDFPGEGPGYILTLPTIKFTGPDGSPEWFRYIHTASVNNADYDFKMVTGNNFTQDYGGNLIFPKNELALLYYQPLGDSPAKLSGGTVSGKRYVFTTKNPGLANTFISVMELSGDPVTITSASRSAGSGLITLNLSATTAADEFVYVRYTDSAWVYSQVIRAQVSGNTATATIPDVKDGRNYAWYAFTSTASPDKFHNDFATDALTLSFHNNGGANHSFAGITRITNFSVNGAGGPYQTTKFFLDEIAGETYPLLTSVTFNAGTPPTEVEVVTNLNRRDKADADGNGDSIPDGILPPARDLCGQNDAHYYRAYPMTAGGSTWTAIQTVSRTGAYRLTVRYRFSPSGPWFYYGDRDHAVVVSPRKTLEMTLYELNPLTIEATSNDQGGRSTFVDLLGAADGDSDGYDHLDLNDFDTLKTNCLWFQPIHPTGALGVENVPNTSTPYVPGSPYATKNFFAVNPYLGSANSEASALSEFQTFVAKADTGTTNLSTINVMLDFVANHTSWDAIYGQGGVDLSFTGSSNTALPANWYSRTGDYGQAATYFTSLTDKDKAVAPDRNDFGKFADTAELYYGRYSALWRLPSYASGSEPHKNEDDFMDWNSLSPEVVKLWRMFAYYPEFWLGKTGHNLTNSTTGTYAQRLAADNLGIDALRCDFGQGLPNPVWEYIINRTRSKKWNFVFMAETLDGNQPGYRNNRVFDILNESLVFKFTADHVNSESDIQSALEERRSTYRTGALLLNITGHDELLPDNDTWVNASRYGMLASVPGLPLIFYGMEHGTQNYNTSPGFEHYDGFQTDHELNFGKRIPHFKMWNRAQFWTQPPPNNTGLVPWYGQVNQARLKSPAIQSLNQFYLDQRPNGGGTPNSNLWAVAKYEQGGGSPAFKDVVLCFGNVLPHSAAHAVASDTLDLRGGGDVLWNLLGLSNASSRLYNVRNLASSNPAALIYPTPKTGADLYANGIFVSLGGGTSNSIAANGELVQYLKVMDVTPPPSSSPQAAYYQIGTTGTFHWTSQAGPHDNIKQWQISIGTTPGGSDVLNGLSLPGSSTQHSFNGLAGATYYATLTPISDAGVSATTSGQSDAGLPNPASTTTPVILLSAIGDQDHDGMSNGDEDQSGTNPLNQLSRLRIVSLQRNSTTSYTVFWESVPGKAYIVQSSPDLQTPFTDISPQVGATGSQSFWTDSAATGDRKFYKVRLVVP